MAFETDILRAFAASSVAARAANPIDEIAVLSQRVLALERIVARLAAYKVEGGGGTPTMVGDHLLRMLREISEDAG